MVGDAKSGLAARGTVGRFVRPRAFTRDEDSRGTREASFRLGPRWCRKKAAMRRVSVKVRAALLYLFSGTLVYLAGVYVNPLYYYLYIFLSLLPVFSALQVALTVITLRCTQ